MLKKKSKKSVSKMSDAFKILAYARIDNAAVCGILFKIPFELSTIFSFKDAAAQENILAARQLTQKF